MYIYMYIYIYTLLRNSASGPQIGLPGDIARTATGKTPKSALRPAGGPISVLSQ